MTTYYVKPTGDDAKDGLSLANAWQTIPYTWGTGDNDSIVVEGDTVLFMDGDYGLFRENIQEDGFTVKYRTDWVTYQAEIGQDAVIFEGIDILQAVGSDPDDSEDDDGISYLKFIGINITAISEFLRTSFIHIEDCTVSTVSTGIEGFYAPYVTPVANGIHCKSIKNLTVINTEVKNCYRGIGVTKTADGTFCSDITITGCEIHDCAEDGTVIIANNVIVEDNFMHRLFNKRAPVNITSITTSIGDFTSEETVTQDVSGTTGVFYVEAPRSGFDIESIWQTSEADFVHILYDLFLTDTGTKTFTLKETYGDVSALFTNGLKVGLNQSNDSNNDGEYTVDSASFNGTYTLVVVDEVIPEAVSPYGRLHYGPAIVGDSSGAIIRSIINEDPEHGDLITIGTGGDNILVNNNILLRNDPDDENGQVLKLDKCTNITVTNNVMAGVRCLLCESNSNFILNNNTMYASTVTAAMRITLVNPDADSVIDEMYNNIIGGLTQDADGAFEANVIAHGNNIFSGDPDGQGGAATPFVVNGTELVGQDLSMGYFTDQANRDYTLIEGSPAIAFGNTNFAPATDILGVTRGSPPDAGAYDSGSSGGIRGRYTGNSAFRLLRSRYILNS